MSFDLPADDDSLETLQRVSIPSTARADVEFRIDRILGTGGMSVAFFALRSAPDGTTPVVLKVMRPSIVRAAGSLSSLIVQKETVALGRLNERVPQTPFVLRLVESGGQEVRQAGARLDLPWLALEYVHGGVEGATLEERVRYSVRQTGHAFDPRRAAHALFCMASGLDAVHGVGVIHRDVKPPNILCCGFGETEIFKIADFGIARPSGVQATFGGIPVGTPGYAAPEQVLLEDRNIGPASDVFSLAALVFHMLTGEEYFPARTPVEAVVLAQDPRRRSIAEGPALCPELRERPAACAAIDFALARATAADPGHRPPTAGELAAVLMPSLRLDAGRLRATARHLRSIARAATLLAGWRWTVRHKPGDDRVVRAASWDGDGRCLSATDSGLAFWNGASWTPAPAEDLPSPKGVRLVHRVGPGAWLVGGDDATIARYSADGVTRVVRGTDPSISYTHASGEPSDLMVLVGASRNPPPTLYAMAARHWLKPALLTKAAFIASVARLEEERWLVVGRAAAGDGFAAIYAPLQWEVVRLKTLPVRAYLSCAAETDLGVGIVVGTGGKAARVARGAILESTVPGEPDLSAVALDINGCAWAGSAGSLWCQQLENAPRWARAWNDPAWQVPFVSVFADVGLVIAMTADGAIVEGRQEAG